MGIIYKLTSPSGKVYIGQCKRKTRKTRKPLPIHRMMKLRWNEHCRATSGCRAIKKAIAKYGPESFSKEILVEVDDDKLDDNERKFIDLYSSTKSRFGYNRTPGGEGGGFSLPAVRDRMRLPDSAWMKSQKNHVTTQRKQEGLAKAKEKDPTIERRRVERLKAVVQSEEYRTQHSKLQMEAQNKPETVSKRKNTWEMKREKLLESMPVEKRDSKRKKLELSRISTAKLKKRIKEGHIPGSLKQSEIQGSEEVNSKRKATLARKREEQIMKLPPDQREKKREQLRRQRESYKKCMAQKALRTTN
jgi:hypothetical protein